MRFLQLQWWSFLGSSSLAWARSQGHGIPACMLPRPWQPSMGMQPKPWHTRCLGTQPSLCHARREKKLSTKKGN